MSAEQQCEPLTVPPSPVNTLHLLPQKTEKKTQDKTRNKPGKKTGKKTQN